MSTYPRLLHGTGKSGNRQIRSTKISPTFSHPSRTFTGDELVVDLTDYDREEFFEQLGMLLRCEGVPQ